MNLTTGEVIVPLVDLKALHARHQVELLRAVADLPDRSSFILGDAVRVHLYDQAAVDP